MASQEAYSQLGTMLTTIMASLLKKSDSGPLGHFREIGSFARYVKNASEKYADNDFLNGYLSSDGGGDESVEAPDIENIDDDKLFADLKAFVASLESETDNLGQVKEFIYGAAESFAGAARGGFLGRGKKVNAEEQAFLDRLRTELGI